MRSAGGLPTPERGITVSLHTHPHFLSNPVSPSWPITIIIVIVVVLVPSTMLHQTLADMITLSALLMGAQGKATGASVPYNGGSAQQQRRR